MTKTFTTNSNNDIFIRNNGNLSISDGIEAVLQACQTAVKAQLGEMIFSVDEGVPNFETIWVGSPNILQYEAALRKTILSIDGVQEITNLDVTVQNNILSYVAVILTEFGQGVING